MPNTQPIGLDTAFGLTFYFVLVRAFMCCNRVMSQNTVTDQYCYISVMFDLLSTSFYFSVRTFTCRLLAMWCRPVRC